VGSLTVGQVNGGAGGGANGGNGANGRACPAVQQLTYVVAPKKPEPPAAAGPAAAGEEGGEPEKKFEERLNKIRKDLTRTLGSNHGRVVLKSAKPTLETRIGEFRAELEVHQNKVAEDLQSHIDETMTSVVDFYLPVALKNPPDAIIGQSLSREPDEETVRKWLTAILDRVFPRSEDLINKMTLDVTFKDVTFETLNRDDFLESVKKAFPHTDWDKAYNEFRAAGEKKRYSPKIEAGI
jgi:hypothetical protein